MSEAQYLDHQAQEARDAISQLVAEMKQKLAAGVDVRAWTKQYPFVTLASAAVAGFLAGTGVVPSKEDQALKRLAKLERALHPEPRHEATDGRHGKHDSHERAEEHRGGFLSGLARELLHAVQPVLASALTAKFVQPPQEQEDGARASSDNGGPGGI